MGHGAQRTVQLGICTSKNIACYLIDLISLQHRALDPSHQAIGGVFAGPIPPYMISTIAQSTLLRFYSIEI